MRIQISCSCCTFDQHRNHGKKKLVSLASIIILHAGILNYHEEILVSMLRPQSSVTINCNFLFGFYRKINCVTLNHKIIMFLLSFVIEFESQTLKLCYRNMLCSTIEAEFFEFEGVSSFATWVPPIFKDKEWFPAQFSFPNSSISLSRPIIY